MFNIQFDKKALSKVDSYVISYRSHFEEMYFDSWLWQVEKIIENYYLESEERYFQILDTIENKLSDTIITYPKNEAIIKWRSKTLFVSLKDEWGTRIITDLEIS